MEFLKFEKWVCKRPWFWPQEKDVSRLVLLKIVFNTCLVMFVLWGEINYAYTNIYQIRVVLNALCPVVSKFSVLFKFWTLFYNRKRLNVLISEFQKIIDNEEQSEHGKDFFKIVKYGIFTSKFLSWNIVVTCAFYSILPIIQIMYSNANGLEAPRELPFKMLFPMLFDTSKSPYYEYLYFVAMFSCYIAMAAFIGVDCSFIGICMHLSAQYKVLSLSIKDFSALKPESEDLEEKEEDKIKLIIKKHTAIIDSSREISQIYRYIVFNHFVAASVVIGFTSINFLLSDWQAKILYANYMFGSFLHAFIYAASGEFITEGSVRLTAEICQLKWYNYSPESRKMILFLIQRAQNDSGIVAPFFQVDLTTFTNIVKTAMSYITVMNTLL